MRFRRLVQFDAGAKTVASISQDRQSYIWVGTFNAGISVASLGTSGFTCFILPARPAPKPEPHNSVMAVAPAPGGPLWVGSSAGLPRLDRSDAAFAVTHFGSGQADIVGAIVPGAICATLAVSRKLRWRIMDKLTLNIQQQILAFLARAPEGVTLEQIQRRPPNPASRGKQEIEFGLLFCPLKRVNLTVPDAWAHRLPTAAQQ